MELVYVRKQNKMITEIRIYKFKENLAENFIKVFTEQSLPATFEAIDGLHHATIHNDGLISLQIERFPASLIKNIRTLQCCGFTIDLSNK